MLVKLTYFWLRWAVKWRLDAIVAAEEKAGMLVFLTCWRGGAQSIHYGIALIGLACPQLSLCDVTGT